MKKLMIACAIATMAALTQAATVKWQSGTLYAPTDATGSCPTSGTTGKDKNYTAYLYYFTSQTAYEAAQSTAVKDLYNTYIVGKVATKVDPVAANAGGIANIQVDAPNGSTEDPQTFYGMVLYVDDTTSKSFSGVDAFVKAGFGIAEYQNTTGATIGSMGTQQTGWAAVSVPEPTSGLLLLLGVAGMALRRRRA